MNVLEYAIIGFAALACMDEKLIPAGIKQRLALWCKYDSDRKALKAGQERWELEKRELHITSHLNAKAMVINHDRNDLGSPYIVSDPLWVSVKFPAGSLIDPEPHVKFLAGEGVETVYAYQCGKLGVIVGREETAALFKLKFGGDVSVYTGDDR